MVSAYKFTKITRAKSNKILEKLVLISWILFLLVLPITNFPYFPSGFGGDSLVRPLSIFPLLLLLVLVTIPVAIKGTLPKTTLALLPFVAIAILSSLVSLLHGIDSLLGISVLQRVIRALTTLGIGLAVYLTTTIVASTYVSLRTTLRWIYIGWSLALLWASFQAVYVIHYSPTYFQWIRTLQQHISTRNLIENRISGTTFEPNWFAEQICLLLLPWLLASITNRYTVFRTRWRWLTIEWLLLGWAVVILALTFSRAGLLSLLILLFVGFIFLRSNNRANHQTERPVYALFFRRFAEAGLAILVILLGLYLVGSKNTFFSRLWDYWGREKKVSFESYLDYLGFGARFTYVSTAYKIYEEHPLLGVGLGNYAFYFEENLPDQMLAETPEVLHILTQSADRYRLITPKNLYLRILAETGLIGFGAFLVFLIAIAGSAIYLYISSNKEDRFWGTGGLYALVSFIFLALSFDSFAFPNMWVVFGMITAATWVSFRRTRSMNDQHISTGLSIAGDEPAIGNSNV